APAARGRQERNRERTPRAGADRQPRLARYDQASPARPGETGRGRVCRPHISPAVVVPLLPRFAGRPPPPRESFKRAGGRLAGVAPAFATMGAVVGTDQIRNALQGVIDPELRRSIVELDMVRAIELSPNGVGDGTVSLTTPRGP